MPIEPGSKLGAYDIAARLGTGGMGEVYRRPTLDWAGPPRSSSQAKEAARRAVQSDAGLRFLMLRGRRIQADATTDNLTVVTNGFTELRERVPVP